MKCLWCSTENDAPFCKGPRIVRGNPIKISVCLHDYYMVMKNDVKLNTKWDKTQEKVAIGLETDWVTEKIKYLKSKGIDKVTAIETAINQYKVLI